MRVAVFGATGVVGLAAVEHLAGVADDGVVAVSRRPVEIPGVTHVPLDLVAGPARLEGITHVVYAASQEAPDLVAGWHDRELMERNLRMFRHALEPLLDGPLEHVSLLQGAKAYGLHVGRDPLPAKERLPRAEHDNFYFLQEDLLRERAAGGSWSWTILRPQVVYGESIGSPMNLLPAIGAYAAVEYAAGRPLSFPGGGRSVQEAADAGLLARVLAWAATAPAARGETFNVTNGDVFDWHEVWPVIAAALGMEVGHPAPQHLAETMPPRAEEWARVVDVHGLRAPRDLEVFVGSAWQYADVLLGIRGRRPLPALLSTVKLRQAGFGECLDTEDMFRDRFARLRHRKLLP